MFILSEDQFFKTAIVNQLEALHLKNDAKRFILDDCIAHVYFCDISILEAVSLDPVDVFLMGKYHVMRKNAPLRDYHHVLSNSLWLQKRGQLTSCEIRIIKMRNPHYQDAKYRYVNTADRQRFGVKL